MNRRQKHANVGGEWQRPTEPLVNEWLRPQYKQRTDRPVYLARNKWEYKARRIANAAWKRKHRKQAEKLLDMGAVVSASYVYDFPFEDYGRITKSQPAGKRWIDYIPLQGSREYSVASGEDYPCNDVAYFIPEFTFYERLDYHNRIGMPKHDAREAARLAVLDAARKHLSNDAVEIYATITVDGEEYYSGCNWSEEFVDTDNPLSVLEFIADNEGIDWIIRIVEAERAELAAGQIGPRE